MAPHKMLLIAIALILTVAWSSWGAPLDCGSHVRIIFPELFTHCTTCQYSDWSEWEFVKDSTVDVPTSQCNSGQSYTETRKRSANGDPCVSDIDIETRVVCFPDQEDLLIEALGMGSTPLIAQIDQETTETTDGDEEQTPTLVPGVSRRQTSQNLCPASGKNGPICTGAPYSTGKRSLSEENQPFINRATRKREEPAPLPEAPIPYNRKEHGKRFRRSHNAHCQQNGEQHVLIVLDTSGSIGQAAFTRMTTAVSKLTALFCRPPKIAAMTFDHRFNLEFCFDCFSTDYFGRADASAAIRNIQWRAGFTYTGEAVRCVCEELLTPACGLHPSANCIDVVFITDGHSNDPHLKVCEEVKCLHNHLNEINVHAIGITSSVNSDEIECIASNSNLKTVFTFKDFADFEYAIDQIIDRLLQYSDKYSCAHTDGSVGSN